jgi:hypothetical protein
MNMIYHSVGVSTLVGVVAFLPEVIQPVYTMLLDVVFLSGTVIVLTFSYAVASCVQAGSPILPTLVSISTLGLLGLWYFHRSCPNCNLLVERSHNAMSMAGAIGLLVFLQLHLDHLELFLPVLMGALLTVLCCATLTSVADVWNSVGSGQFWMISLDTSTMLLYLVAPTIVLGYRANDTHGDSIRTLLGDMAKHLHFATPLATTSAAMLLGLAICTGVTLIAMLCPFGAHFFGKVYTTGQAATRKVALCVNWSDQVTEDALQDFPAQQVLTFLVTYEQLRQDSARLQTIVAMGHSISISSDDAKDLVDACQLHQTLFSQTPEWTCPGQLAWSPNVVHAAATLNLKVGLWSHGIRVTGTCLTPMQAKSLQTDLEGTMGGTILYLMGSTTSVLPVARQILTEYAKTELSFCSLSLVAKNDMKMELTLSS